MSLRVREGANAYMDVSLNYVISSIILRARYDLNLSLNITRKNQVVRGIAFPKELYEMFRELSKQTGLSINKLVNIASLHFFLCLKQYNIDLRKLLFEKKVEQNRASSIVDEIEKMVNGDNGEKEVEDLLREVEECSKTLEKLEKLQEEKENGVWRSFKAFKEYHEASKKAEKQMRKIKAKLRNKTFLSKLRKVEKTNRSIVIRLHEKLKEVLSRYEMLRER